MKIKRSEIESLIDLVHDKLVPKAANRIDEILSNLDDIEIADDEDEEEDIYNAFLIINAWLLMKDSLSSMTISPLPPNLDIDILLKGTPKSSQAFLIKKYKNGISIKFILVSLAISISFYLLVRKSYFPKKLGVIFA